MAVSLETSSLSGVRLSGSLPIVIEPDAELSLSWLEEHAAQLKSLLTQHGGAILFRGFPIASPADFSRVVSAFDALGWRDLPYEDSLSLAVRLPVVPRVCTTNEGKLGGMTLHHEQAAAPLYPSHLFFYCETPATWGGGTAVSPSAAAYDFLEAHHPRFLDNCTTKGVVYKGVLQGQHDMTMGKGVGRSWRSFFSCESREEAEKRMASLGYSFRWEEGDVLHFTSPVLSAVRTVEGPGGATKVFFNQMVAHALSNAKEFTGDRAPLASVDKDGTALAPELLLFGDGSRVPLQPILEAAAACEAASSTIQWQAGDVALLDNMLVLHARREFEGPRRVLASLVQ